MTIRVAMWSGPRNLSTAMMRSFGSRADTFVSDEPFYGCFLKTTGADHPMREAVIASMDCDSRAVLAWRLSNTMDAAFCVEALEEALARWGRPEIFNTDQGSQFTGAAFTGTLAAAGIRISMDGRGRWIDNIFIERLWRSLK